jgi:hypothetical protein
MDLRSHLNRNRNDHGCVAQKHCQLGLKEGKLSDCLDHVGFFKTREGHPQIIQRSSGLPLPPQNQTAWPRVADCLHLKFKGQDQYPREVRAKQNIRGTTLSKGATSV